MFRMWEEDSLSHVRFRFFLRWKMDWRGDRAIPLFRGEGPAARRLNIVFPEEGISPPSALAEPLGGRHMGMERAASRLHEAALEKSERTDEATLCSAAAHHQRQPQQAQRGRGGFRNAGDFTHQLTYLVLGKAGVMNVELLDGVGQLGIKQNLVDSRALPPLALNRAV